LPCISRYLVVQRVNHFTKIALMVAVATLFLALLKFELSLRAEQSHALEALENTGKTVAKSLKLQMEADMSTLDGVANLWALNSRISRMDYRRFITSPYFKDRLLSMNTVMLVHRIKPWQRDSYETDPESVVVRTDCCNGTKYDIPGSTCRAKAKNQCNIPGANRFFITEFVTVDGKTQVLPATADASGRNEYLVIMYQEPYELNPGPTGFDIGSQVDRRAAFYEADKTGLKVVSKRLLRVFAARKEFGMLVLNNVFVNNVKYGDKTLLDGVPIASKSEVMSSGGEPYFIGSVVAVYLLEPMLIKIINKVFGREIQNTRIYLFDDGAAVSETERLIGLYDPSLSEDQMMDLVIELSERTKAELLFDKNSQVNTFALEGTKAVFSVGMVPNSNYLAAHVSQVPYYILGISIAIIAISQFERWLGHPWIVSEHELIRAAIEQDLRSKIDEEMKKRKAACLLQIVASDASLLSPSDVAASATSMPPLTVQDVEGTDTVETVEL